MRKPSQLTIDIREGIKMGLDNEAIAQLCDCTTVQVSKVRSRDKHRVKERARRKHRVYNARYYAKKKAKHEAKLAALRQVESLLSEPEVEALQGVNIDAVHKQELPISMESASKYTFFERVKILFRGWA